MSHARRSIETAQLSRTWQAAALVALWAPTLSAGWCRLAHAAEDFPRRIDAKHLPNALLVAPGVISGGLPEGDEAFAELAALGVKTVISVDGARPDVARAEEFGLRYVHLPHGYDGISFARGLELAKAVKTLPKAIYIHCHHGKHRSPAAACVACVSVGMLPAAKAHALLELAGTSPQYVGLYAAAEAARPVEAAVLDALGVEFVPIAKLPPLAEAMVETEHALDRLKQVAMAGWRAPGDDVALDPAHLALLLREQYTELLRLGDVLTRPASFRELLAEAEANALRLEGATAVVDRPPGAAQREKLDALLEAATRDCKTCHAQFRDRPKNSGP